jgi:hypothetical protein
MTYMTKWKTNIFNTCYICKIFFKSKIKCTSLPKRSLQTNCPKLAPESSQKYSAVFALLDSLYRDKWVVIAKIVCAFLKIS